MYQIERIALVPDDIPSSAIFGSILYLIQVFEIIIVYLEDHTPSEKHPRAYLAFITHRRSTKS